MNLQKQRLRQQQDLVLTRYPLYPRKTENSYEDFDTAMSIIKLAESNSQPVSSLSPTGEGTFHYTIIIVIFSKAIFNHKFLNY